jgi:2,4-dienoyl-CoA reductase-like NADH-dependent reductase (Old Yellow Enzyme family)
MGDKSLLFTPYQIGGLELKNRMIVTAMHTGFSIDQEAAFLKVRAKGGAAAVTATMGVSNSGAQFNMCVLNDVVHPPFKLAYFTACTFRHSRLLPHPLNNLRDHLQETISC